jgi:hypothetical protein
MGGFSLLFIIIETIFSLELAVVVEVSESVPELLNLNLKREDLFAYFIDVVSFIKDYDGVI